MLPRGWGELNGPAGAALPGPLLSVSGLSKTFRAARPFFVREARHAVRAVRDISFRLAAAETLALVGESGSGKSTTARLVLRLLAPDAGEVRFDGVDWLSLPPAELNRARRHVGVVFQDPGTSLDPRLSVGAVVGEPLSIHGIGTPAGRRERVAALLRAVGLSPDASARRPSEFSGGQRQRIAIARALAAEPKLVVLDEPVSALDLSVRSQLLNLLRDLQETTPSHPSYLFIGHDLDVVRHFADRTAVLYLGRIVEEGPTAEVLDAPRHPYTALLLASRPGPHRRGGDASGAARRKAAGEPASAAFPPSGCAFHPRCPRAGAACRVDLPELSEDPFSAGRSYACHDPEPAPRGNFFARSS